MTAPALASRDGASGEDRSSRVRSVAGVTRGWATAVLTVGLAVALLLPVGAVVQIVLTAQLDDRSQTQAIVVLDPARYWGDPGPVLEARLTHAAELYRDGVAPVVVITGPKRSSDVERAALVADGVAPQDVVSFDTGTDTVGSLEVVAEVMRDLGWSAATVVTDPAHAARAQATASALGIDAHLSPTSTGPGTALTSEYVGRETAALLRFYGLTRWSVPQVIR